MDTDILAKLQQHLREHAPHIRSVVVVRHNSLVFEQYNHGLSRDDLHEVHSVTKSVTSALIGIALEKHYLHDLDQKVVDFVPELAEVARDPKAQDITLRHLLTMTSGFKNKEQSIDDCLHFKLSSCSTDMLDLFHDDLIKFAIKRPIVSVPGQTFNYDSFAAHLLSVILTRATKMSTAKFAEQYLFGPLGVSRYRWPTDHQGYHDGAFGLELTTRDMAKLGQLYLNHGVWNGRQIIPSDYVAASTRKQTAGGWPAGADYGYLWWVTPPTDNVAAYFANGKGGQYIMIVPSLDLVIAITSNQGPQRTTGIVREFILPATAR
ncbi:MAG: serine hydrolase [Gammaproteobacteria bacterium]|nr:serine hydrolase [Gammaproteobacteria bacterium]